MHPTNPAQAVADGALKDGRLSLSEANGIWRANTDPNFAVTVDASLLDVSLKVGFNGNGVGIGIVQGSDWLVHGTVVLNQTPNGSISIQAEQYSFDCGMCQGV